MQLLEATCKFPGKAIQTKFGEKANAVFTTSTGEDVTVWGPPDYLPFRTIRRGDRVQLAKDHKGNHRLFLNAQPEYAALERMIGLKATKPNSKTSDLHTLAKTLDILQVIGRRAVGEPISGINQHDTAAVQPDGDPEDRKHRIEELLKRRQQLEVQIKQIKKQSS